MVADYTLESTHLESRESDRLSSTTGGVGFPVGGCGGLINQIETDGKVDALLNAGCSKDIAGSNTGLLENDWSLDRSCRHDDFETGGDGVRVGLFVTELETCGTWGRPAREENLSNVGSGQNYSQKRIIRLRKELTGQIGSGFAK